jgi:hypothetical protein
VVADRKTSAIMNVVSSVVPERETLLEVVRELRELLVNYVLNVAIENLLAEMLVRDNQDLIDLSAQIVEEGLLAEMLVRDDQDLIDLSVQIVEEGPLAEMLVRDDQDMTEPSALNVALEVTVAVIGVGGVDEC